MQRALLADQLHQLMDSLRGQITSLNHCVAEATLIEAKVFRLPPPEPKEQTRPRDVMISPTHCEGDEARGLAQEAWINLFADGDQSTRLAYRLPGAIAVSTQDEDSIRSLVHEINLTKDQFKGLITSAPFLTNLHDRFEFLHSAHMFPRLITLHAYRHIECAVSGVRSISFCWARKPSQVRTNKQAMLTTVANDQRRQPRLGISNEEWQSLLDHEIRILHSLSDREPLVVRRDLPAAPQAWLVSSSGARKMHIASTPILVINDYPRKIGFLPEHDPSEVKTGTRTRLTSSTPLIGRLNLYTTEV